MNVHRVWEKSCPLIFFTITVENMDQFSYFFTVKFRKDLQNKMELKPSPPIKSVTTPPCEKISGHLYSFTARLIQFKVMKNI